MERSRVTIKPSAQAAPVILWFRRDLRLADNPALNHAAETGCAIVPGHSVLQADGRYLVTYEPPIFFGNRGGNDVEIKVCRNRNNWPDDCTTKWYYFT